MCSANDLKGLTDFKAGIRTDTSSRLQKWRGYSCCKWEGVTCNNTTKRVTEIRLPGFISTDDFVLQTKMEGRISASLTLLSSLEVIDLGGLIGLFGEIPPLIGFKLPRLRKLHIYGNKLSGPIPESIGKLSKLEELLLYENTLSGKFRSTYNSLSGHIPDKIGNIQALEELDLSSNLLSGKIPSSITNLSSTLVIYLDTNFLEGELPFMMIPSPMSSLSFLRLHDNQLTGPIPPGFGHLVSLQRVSLANNKLEGAIPSSLGNLSMLSELYLHGNQLSGHLPKSLGQLSQLILLTVSHNSIQGPLPHEMSTLQNLQSLDMSYNHLNLPFIPKWLAELPSLSRIYLAGCSLQGEIPEFLKTTPSPLQELDLSDNHLSGSLPTWLGDLRGLYSLNLSRNMFISIIPETITSLQYLGVLDLHSNELTGSVSQIFKIKSRFSDGSLTHVDLSANKFTAGIEQLGVGSQLNIQFLDISRNLLKGGLPTTVGKLKSVQSLDLSYNELGSDLPESLSNISMLERLKLQDNQFTGAIPPGFLKLKELRELNLSDNLLVGRIPLGKPLSDFPPSSYSGNRGLCGKPLLPCKF
ncbi:Leucine-rich repeat-containing N-terminal, plant-type [Dillenia turbinata]|uniref:Leucine-rich repeat-containing N-terminal, plant-type n=1 Tax=Dillenia turbinata TaxID=194707 RepID=A0AAN8VKM8_9MAGN